MLTARERALVECVRWLINAVHEAHHRAGVPSQHRRPAEECGSPICRYGLKVLAGAERKDKDTDEEEEEK